MSVGRSVRLSVRRSACLSVSRSAPTSFMEVLCCCQCIYVVSIVVAQIIRTFCCHILHQLQQQLYKSQCRSVCVLVGLSATSLIEVLCCWQCIYVVGSVYMVLLILKLRFLAAIAALYMSQCRSVCRSVGLSVGRSVRNEFYRSFMLLVVYICCYSYFSFII